VSVGVQKAASALGGSNLMVVVASPPSSRSQAVPLPTERRAVGMIYNCSTKSEVRGVL
jgi:hypothetical protein